MPAYFFIGWLGRFYEPLGPAAFWALTAALPLTAAAAIVLGKGWFKRLMEPEHMEEMPAAEAAQ